MVKKSEKSYATLRSELDAVLAALQEDELDVDRAVELYKQGLELVRELESYLKTAENKVVELKAQFDDELA